MRIGQSIDIHKLVDNRKLVLGTVEITYPLGLLGHSDGDCLTHAIVNSLIGAMGLGDIGLFFPDSDPKYEGIASSYFLTEVKKMLDKNKFKIVNIDCTVVIENPILRPYIDSMRYNIATLLDIESSQINIKATRGEKLGFIGNGEGVLASCSCLIDELV